MSTTKILHKIKCKKFLKNSMMKLGRKITGKMENLEIRFIVSKLSKV